MAERNEHTGASLATKPTTKAYEENFDRIFGKKNKKAMTEEVLKNAEEVKQMKLNFKESTDD